LRRPDEASMLFWDSKCHWCAQNHKMLCMCLSVSGATNQTPFSSLILKKCLFVRY
jgi:hypothetical protein